MTDIPVDEPKDDLRASLEAAFAADAGDAAPAAPAPVAPAAGAAPATPAPEGQAAPPAGDRQRDEGGRFAPKPAAPAADPKTPDLSAAPAPEAQAEPIRPPAAWSAPAKAKFATLDPEVQREIVKRETDVTRGFEERSAALKRFEPLDQAIAPIRSRLALNGLDDASYVRALIGADEMLRGPNKLQALAQVAQQYGIDLRALGQPGQQLPQGAQQHPEIQQLAHGLAQVQATLTQQQTAQQQSVQAQQQADIAAFARDNIYFENVRPQVAALLRSGVPTLKEAYEQACWARPDIRPLVLAEQESARQAATAEAARQRASEARQAAGSITGAPAPGAVPNRSGPPPSVRESLERGFGVSA